MPVYFLDGRGMAVSDVSITSGHPVVTGTNQPLLEHDRFYPSALAHDCPFYEHSCLVLKDAKVSALIAPGWTVVSVGSTSFLGSTVCQRLLLGGEGGYLDNLTRPGGRLMKEQHKGAGAQGLGLLAEFFGAAPAKPV